MSEAMVLESIESLEYDPDGIALDIGANHGIYTRKLAEKFGLVYAFEPHPDNVEILKENLKDLENVEIVSMAISNVNVPIHLFTNETNHGGHSTSFELVNTESYGHSLKRSIFVNGITLDLFCRGKNVKFIKCDIEGAENFIFNQDCAGRFLSESKDLKIILEVHREVDLNKLYDNFTNLGYCFVSEQDVIVNKLEHDQHYRISR